MSIPSTLISGFIGLASCGLVGSLIVNSLWLIEVDPHRGGSISLRPYKVWTVLHNFDCRAADGTTPASRFFRRGFPDLFETVLSHVEDLPRPRQRNPIIALSG